LLQKEIFLRYWIGFFWKIKYLYRLIQEFFEFWVSDTISAENYRKRKRWERHRQ